jgi:hypothetical protein
MLLEYRRPNRHTVAFRAVAPIKDFKDTPGAREKDPAPVIEFSLIQGINEVDSDVWEQAKKFCPSLPSMLKGERVKYFNADSEEYEFKSLQAAIVERGELEDASEADEETVFELVTNCAIPSLLRKIAEIVTKPTIREAIVSQLEKLKLKPGAVASKELQAG